MVLNMITRDLSKPKASRVAPSLLKPSLPDERIARQASPISIMDDDFTIGDLVGESMAEGLRAVTPSPGIRESTAPGLAAAGSPPSPEILRDFSRLGAAPEPRHWNTEKLPPVTATPSPEILCNYFERLGAAAVGAGAEQRVTPSPPVGLAAGPDAEWLLNATAGLRDKGALRDEVAAPVPRRHSCSDLVERATGRSDRRSPDMSLVAGVSDRFGFRSVADMKLLALVRSESSTSLDKVAGISPRHALLRASSSPSLSPPRTYEAVVDPDAASVDPDAASDDGDRFLRDVVTSMPLAKVVRVVLLSRVGRLRAIVDGLRALVAGDGALDALLSASLLLAARDLALINVVVCLTILHLKLRRP